LLGRLGGSLALQISHVLVLEKRKTALEKENE
jgi:hypothetical protein